MSSRLWVLQPGGQYGKRLGPQDQGIGQFFSLTHECAPQLKSYPDICYAIGLGFESGSLYVLSLQAGRLLIMALTKHDNLDNDDIYLHRLRLHRLDVDSVSIVTI